MNAGTSFVADLEDLVEELREAIEAYVDAGVARDLPALQAASRALKIADARAVAIVPRLSELASLPAAEQKRVAGLMVPLVKQMGRDLRYYENR
jgi:hypothetical protein